MPDHYVLAHLRGAETTLRLRRPLRIKSGHVSVGVLNLEVSPDAVANTSPVHDTFHVQRFTIEKKQYIKFVPGISLVVSLKTTFRDAWRYDFDAAHGEDGHLVLSIPHGKALKLDPALAVVLGFDAVNVWGAQARAPHARHALYAGRREWGKYLQFCALSEEHHSVPPRFYETVEELKAVLPAVEEGVVVTPSASLREKLDYGPSHQPLLVIQCPQAMHERGDRTLRRVASAGQHSYRHVLYKRLQPTHELSHLRIRLRTWLDEPATLLDALSKPIHLMLHLHYV